MQDAMMQDAMARFSELARVASRVVRLVLRFVAEFFSKTGDHFSKLCLAAPKARRSIAGAELRRAAPGAILCIGLLVLLLTHPDGLLNDPDTFWHIVVGRSILATWSVPWTDPYSHTFAGAPWIAKEWLSQVILYLAHAAAGWWGVVMVAALAIAGTFTILFAWLRHRLPTLVALAATLLAALLACPHFLARPHVLVLPIVVLWVTRLVSALERGEPPPLRLAGLMALWANMHGSFPLGLVIAGVLAGEGVLLRPAGSRWRAARGWAAILATSTAATALSPYGWHAIVVPLMMSGNAETLRFISEWQPLRFDLVGGLALGLLGVSLVVLATDARRAIFRIIAVALLAYLMIRHVRFISLFAILAPILVAGSLARLVRARGALYGTALSERMVQGGQVVALVGLAAVAVLLAGTMRPEPVPRYTPEIAFQAALDAGVSGPVYNDYDFGGFLIAHGVKTFVDGRTDQLFLGDFLPALDRASKAESDAPFGDLLTRHGVRWALVRSGSRAAAHLARLPGWSALHRDEVAAVFVKG